MYFCVKHLRIGYRDVMNMPTYERRFYLDCFKEEMDAVNDKSSRNSKSGKSISGEQLKNSIKSGQIPNQ